MSEKITVSFAQEHGISEQALAVAGLEDPKAVILLGDPGRAFIDCTDQTDANGIVVGSYKTGPSDYVAGATTLPVVLHTPCSRHVPR